MSIDVEFGGGHVCREMNAETGRRCRPEQALLQGAGGDAFGNFLRITAVESQNVAGSKGCGQGY
jgi:hypothetical protein